MNFFKGKWRYDNEDKSTWKYKGFIIENDGSNKKIRWIRNPLFSYENLSPYGLEVHWNLLDKDQHYAVKTRKIKS